jgi:hypothetical protein
MASKELPASHFSWMGLYSPGFERNLDAEFEHIRHVLIRMLGCEFRLTGIRIQSPINSGGKLSLRLRGENQGVAPFYWMWPWAGGLLDMNGELVKTSDTRIDIRKWPPCNVDEALPGWRRSAR